MVGDSKIILASHQRGAVIKYYNLTKLVNSVNALLTHFGLAQWRHVYRRNNKMADHLANVAMDTRLTKIYSPISSTPTSKQIF